MTTYEPGDRVLVQGLGSYYQRQEPTFAIVIAKHGTTDGYWVAYMNISERIAKKSLARPHHIEKVTDYSMNESGWKRLTDSYEAKTGRSLG